MVGVAVSLLEARLGMTTAGNCGPVSPGAPGNLYLVLMLGTFYFSEKLPSFEKLKIFLLGVFWPF